MSGPFVASLASLTLRMVTIASTICLLQEMEILPTTATCSTCHTSMGQYKTNHHYHYFECGKCHHKTSILHNTVLSNSNMKLREFVLLMYQFCGHHKTYETVIKETHLPQPGYKETYLCGNTINKWFSYFRYLCMEDAMKNVQKIGGEDDVVEMDETMCGKMKYGKEIQPREEDSGFLAASPGAPASFSWPCAPKTSEPERPCGPLFKLMSNREQCCTLTAGVPTGAFLS